MSAFVLDPRLAGDGLPIGRFALSRLLLMNDATFPWLILVPERAGASEIFDLAPDDLALLGAETALVARMLKGLVGADKINVAALGNVVAQLHVHVIARFAADPAWPAPIWGRAPARPYDADEAMVMRAKLTRALDALAMEAAAAAVPGSPEVLAAAGWRPLAP